MILDTNALSAWADGTPGCRAAFLQARLIVIPAIVLGEFRFGILQSRHRVRYEQWLSENLRVAELGVIGDDAATRYVQIRLHLKSRGTPIPPNDMWIAAFVLTRNLPLLSNDAHFDLVPNLTRIPFDG